ncbi:MAG TPA: DUF4345 family protein [Hyphomonas sp.]|nr:DUF4345 family protein [Hyphomonas sp.]MCC0017757.1 DUF4345 family protein [Rhodobiaceae bacterium]HPE46773.1 DUF4345 family protein [Hyphomonas sp.]
MAEPAVLILIAILFAVMGISSIVAPLLTTAQFGINELGRDGRNEVRAIYGGFGMAMAGVLVVATLMPELRAGVSLTVAVALGGMAAGRVLSAALDGSIGRKPAFYLGLEFSGFALLFWVSGIAMTIL